MANVLRVDGVEYKPDEGVDQPDPFPNFRISGVYLPTGEAFEYDMALELDGRDMDGVPISGLDLFEVPDDPGDISDELYRAVEASDAYKKVESLYRS